MVSINGIVDYATDLGSRVPTAALIGGSAVAAGAAVGAAALATRSRSTKRRSTRRTNRKSTRANRKRYTPHTAGKRRDTSRRRIRHTSTGQPYVILASGKARFISKRNAKSSRKRSGGKY